MKKFREFKSESISAEEFHEWEYSNNELIVKVGEYLESLILKNTILKKYYLGHLNREGEDWYEDCEFEYYDDISNKSIEYVFKFNYIYTQDISVKTRKLNIKKELDVLNALEKIFKYNMEISDSRKESGDVNEIKVSLKHEDITNSKDRVIKMIGKNDKLGI